MDLACGVDDGFALFTQRMGDWWPVEHFSVSGSQVRSVVVETTAGGRVYEVDDEGRQFVWADVTACEATHRIALAWYPDGSAEMATTVEVTLEGSDSASTLRLVHSGWEQVDRASAGAQRDGYDHGWVDVLCGLVELVAASNRTSQ